MRLFSHPKGDWEIFDLVRITVCAQSNSTIRKLRRMITEDSRFNMELFERLVQSRKECRYTKYKNMPDKQRDRTDYPGRLL